MEESCPPSHPASVSGVCKEKHVPAAWLGIQPVGEPRLDAGTLVQERQGADVAGQVVRQTRAVFPRLRFHPGERVAHGLRLHHARALAVHVKEVVGGTMAVLQSKLTHRNAAGGTHVQSSPCFCTAQPACCSSRSMLARARCSGGVFIIGFLLEMQRDPECPLHSE